MPPEPGASNPTQPLHFPQSLRPSPRDGAGAGWGQPQPAAAARPARSRGLRWAAGIAVAAILIGGGTALAAGLTSSNTPATGVSLTGSTAPLSGQLGSVLGTPAGGTVTGVSAGMPGGGQVSPPGPLSGCLKAARSLRASGNVTAARAKRRSCLRGLRGARWLRMLLRGEHGQITVRTKTGSREIAFERGTITSVSAGQVVVTAADGTTWTWNLTAKTVVSRARHKVSATALARNEKVLVAGPVIGGVNDARHIAIHG